MKNFKEFIAEVNEKGLVHFTHNDGDGVACYAIPQMYRSMSISDFDIQVIFEGSIPVMNKKIVQFLQDNQDDVRPILITDISINEATRESLEKANITRTVIVIDHHTMHDRKKESNFIKLVPDADGACTILWDYFEMDSFNSSVSNTMKKEIFAAGRYDSFKWTDPNCKENDGTETTLTAILSFYGFEKTIRYIDDNIKFRNCFLDDVTSSEINNCYMLLLDKDLDQMKKNLVVVSDTYTSKIDGDNYDITYAVVSGYQYISYNAKRCLDEIEAGLNPDIPKCDFIVGIRPMSGHFELRSVRDDVNVGRIAKEFGGGGHSKAAGFSLPIAKALKVYSDYVCALNENA